MSPTPEQQARIGIDAALEAAGWIVQDRATMNPAAGPGVAVCEFKMASGHGFADYLLFVNGKAVGVLEAKPAGYALTNVELQADKYAAGLNPPVHPLPFLCLSTGVETRFINGLDPDPKTRATDANGLTCADPIHVVLAHLFLHQIHHRGQVHDMLSIAGERPPQLDEFLLSCDAPLRDAEARALGLEK